MRLGTLALSLDASGKGSQGRMSTASDFEIFLSVPPGLDPVLPGLQHDAIPHPIAKTAAHLTAVVETIRSCQRLAVTARSKLLLQRMRDD